MTQRSNFRSTLTIPIIPVIIHYFIFLFVGGVVGDSNNVQKIQVAVVNFRIGRNHLDTEESGDAEKHLDMALQVLLPSMWVDQLEQCRKLLSDDTTKDSKEAHAILTPLDVDVTRAPTHEYIPETIDALNQSGILWTRRGELQRALLLLEMSHRLFRMVVAQLEKNDTVIGPAEDGGYYLLGMKTLYHSVFDIENWGTDTVYKQTISKLNNKSVYVLETLNDIDYIEDLHPYDVFRTYIK